MGELKKIISRVCSGKRWLVFFPRVGLILTANAYPSRFLNQPVDVALSRMRWNYTDTTGNFRRLTEGLGSRRIRVMWGPADNRNSGEWDVATAGFHNVRPYLYGLHLKDLHVIDPRRLQFEYRPIGSGDVDYRIVLRNLRDHGCDVFLSLATHFRPPSGSREEGMPSIIAISKT